MTGLQATGLPVANQRLLNGFPTPAELWASFHDAENLGKDHIPARLLPRANHTTGKEPRYYQRIAIDRAILRAQRRVLLTMGTKWRRSVPGRVALSPFLGCPTRADRSRRSICAGLMVRRLKTFTNDLSWCDQSWRGPCDQSWNDEVGVAVFLEA